MTQDLTPTLPPTQALRWDAHACLPLHPDASFAPLQRYAAKGVDYVSVNVGMDMSPVEQVMAVIAGFRARIAAEPERYALVGTVTEVEAARATGRLALGFDLEGALPLLERPEMVALYRSLGVRQIHFAYNRNNSVAGGCHDSKQGLTALGRRMVEAVNAAGLLMDCSHTGWRSTLDIMEASSAPVIFSHANPATLVAHGRNITDEQIQACAATGGVVCINGISAFLGSEQPDADDLARHAAYVAERVGAAHVGLGLDVCFSEPGLDDDPPGGLDRDYWWPASAGYGHGLAQIRYAPVETWGEIEAALRRAGFSTAETDGVMGSNMARVARQVWGG